MHGSFHADMGGVTGAGDEAMGLLQEAAGSVGIQKCPYIALNVLHEISYVSNMVPDLLQIAPFHLFPVFEADDYKRTHVKLEVLCEMPVFRHLHVHYPPFDLPLLSSLETRPGWRIRSSLPSSCMSRNERYCESSRPQLLGPRGCRPCDSLEHRLHRIERRNSLGRHSPSHPEISSSRQRSPAAVSGTSKSFATCSSLPVRFPGLFARSCSGAADKHRPRRQEARKAA